MRVQRVVMASGAESSTVLSDGLVIEPVEQFLAHLTAIERSPNTVRAYAHDLSDFFSYLQIRDLEWTEVRLEDLGRFVAWLRLPSEARTGQVASLPWVEGALSSFDREPQALRVGVVLRVPFATRRGRLQVVDEVAPRPQRRIVEAVSVPSGGEARAIPGRRPAPRTPGTTRTGAGRDEPVDRGLRPAAAIVSCSACWRARACASARRSACATRTSTPAAARLPSASGSTPTGARAKTWSRDVPVDAGLIRLYSDYLHEEYGPLDCDYVFVNLWREPVGEPMAYASVNRLVLRLRGQHRHRLHASSVPALLCHQSPAARRGAGSRPEAHGPCFHLDDDRHLLSPPHRGRPDGALVAAGVLSEMSPRPAA